MDRPAHRPDRPVTWALALGVLLLVVAGCSDDASPTEHPDAQAPDAASHCPDVPTYGRGCCVPHSNMCGALLVGDVCYPRISLPAPALSCDGTPVMPAADGGVDD